MPVPQKFSSAKPMEKKKSSVPVHVDDAAIRASRRWPSRFVEGDIPRIKVSSLPISNSFKHKLHHHLITTPPPIHHHSSSTTKTTTETTSKTTHHQDQNASLPRRRLPLLPRHHHLCQSGSLPLLLLQLLGPVGPRHPVRVQTHVQEGLL